MSLISILFFLAFSSKLNYYQIWTIRQHPCEEGGRRFNLNSSSILASKLTSFSLWFGGICMEKERNKPAMSARSFVLELIIILFVGKMRRFAFLSLKNHCDRLCFPFHIAFHGAHNLTVINEYWIAEKIIEIFLKMDWCKSICWALGFEGWLWFFFDEQLTF